MPTRSTLGFLLTRNWRDRQTGIELEYWFATDTGPLRVTVRGERAVFFLRQAEFDEAAGALQRFRMAEVKSVKLRAFDLSPVKALYFSSYRQARSCADQLIAAGFDPLEADINPAERYLMERFITGSAELVGEVGDAGEFRTLEQPVMRSAEYRPPLKVVSFDIETALETALEPALERVQLYSIGVHAVGPSSAEERKVFMVGEGASQDFVESYASQAEVLQAFLAWLRGYDPDVLIGWNVVNFDTWYLQRVADLMGVPLSLGREQRPVRWRELDEDGERRTAQLTGRVILDGIELLRAAFYRFESFSLENVSRQILGEGKLLHGSDRGMAISELFQHNKTRLAAYNLKDCELVSDIFKATSLTEFALARSAITGLNLDRLGGSVASFDNLYLPRLHRKGYVAPNARTDQGGSPGGFVLDSQPGIFRHVLVLDFKSLYPSIIRTFCIDPLGLAEGVGGELDEHATVPGFLDSRFAREGHILPALIASLWQRRDAAKAADDAPLSQAIKIIMNSFYGVLGTPGCRFFDARLASSSVRPGCDVCSWRNSVDKFFYASHSFWLWLLLPA